MAPGRSAHVVATLLISGPVGAGKSAVAAEVSEILSRRKIAHAVIDFDALAATYPRPADDPFGSRLAITNLRDVWRNAAAAGARNLVIARVLESARMSKRSAAQSAPSHLSCAACGRVRPRSRSESAAGNAARASPGIFSGRRNWRRNSTAVARPIV